MEEDKEEKEEESREEKRNRRYMNIFHQKESRYLEDLLTDEE